MTDRYPEAASRALNVRLFTTVRLFDKVLDDQRFNEHWFTRYSYVLTLVCFIYVEVRRAKVQLSIAQRDHTPRPHI